MRILILKPDNAGDVSGWTKTAAGDVVVTATPDGLRDHPTMLRAFGADVLVHDGVSKDDFDPDAWLLVRTASVGAAKITLQSNPRSIA